ncbi:transporter suffix domain-containing protein [Chamaesiphon sp. VAR_48_metabat_135_sub]|uniref:transporter suffix domain-containing protein n=1 Tax=Chamaesiphon sp. VAR_48_metabat_135_sub TaxID=2964699 RepID=UPI00286A9248|nr:transporter suffix domain-containing protein [Chamaesiphon sp. VAR_48_metabat_135_sub]
MRAKAYSKLGLCLTVGSCLLWAAVLAVPILPLSIAKKSLVATSLIVISEVMFWLGILLAGKEIAHRYRRNLNPYYWWQKVTKKR